jgi:hypothetical protein
MPQCIFCEKAVPHKICEEHPERSLCIDCLAEIKRFELQNGEEIMERVFPERFIEAYKRIRKVDPSEISSDPEKQAQFQHDLQILQEILPY